MSSLQSLTSSILPHSMEWQPDPSQLRQLVSYLRDSLSGHNVKAQKEASLVRRVWHSSQEEPNH